MNIFHIIHERIRAAVVALAEEGGLPPDIDVARIATEPPRDPSHGDIATNVAMVLAAGAGKKPRALATSIAERLTAAEEIAGIDVAGPGFINIRLHDKVWQSCVVSILQRGRRYGDSAVGSGRSVNIEYVSANPTGPLHVGHGRGAASVTPWPPFSKRAGSRSLGNTMSTMPARRSTLSLDPSTCATGWRTAPKARKLSMR